MGQVFRSAFGGTPSFARFGGKFLMDACLTLHKYDNKYNESNPMKNEGARFWPAPQ